MSARPSLRKRVAITLALFAAAVGLTLATVIYLASHDLEQRLIDETLTAELDDYMARRARNPHSLPEHTATIKGFVIPATGTGGGEVPQAVAALPTGHHRVELNGIDYRAAVRQVGAQRLAVLYDTSALARREQGFVLLLTSSVLLITLLAALVGRSLAARTIAPVDELARRVAALHPEDDPAPLAGQFPWNEVHELALDFDDYQTRLHDFIERERLFTGDVSHELRTPMAVINGATELLLADPEITGKNRERVARIGRAVGEMGEISGALLALAREQSPAVEQPGACDAQAVASELIARYRTLLHGKPVELALEIQAVPQLRADRTVLALVLGNLLRNALGYTEEGEVKVQLERDSISVVDSGPGLSGFDGESLYKPYIRGANSEGAGLGLSLVKRLCDSQGWRISLASRPQGGTVARIDFTTTVSG